MYSCEDTMSEEGDVFPGIPLRLDESRIFFLQQNRQTDHLDAIPKIAASEMLLLCWSNGWTIVSNKLDFYIFQIPDERQ